MLRRTNKALFLTVAVFLAVFILSGCKNNNSNQLEQKPSSENSEVETQELDSEKDFEIEELEEKIEAQQEYQDELESKLDEQQSRQEDLESRLSEQEYNRNDYQAQIEEQETYNEDLGNKLEEQQEYIDGYNDYQDCVSRWKNRDGYIKPSDESLCRLYLK